MQRARWGRAVAVAALVVALGGCGSSAEHAGSVAEHVERGVPADWQGPEPDLLTGAPVVGWLGDDRFGVVTVGSSSCPPVARSIEAIGSVHVRIEFVDSPNDPCTADLGPTTHVFQLPESVTERPVLVTIAAAGDTPTSDTLP